MYLDLRWSKVIYLWITYNDIQVVAVSAFHVPCLDFLPSNEAEEWSGGSRWHNTSLIPVFKHLHLPQPQKSTTEWWQSQPLCCAILCSTAAVKRATSVFMCHITLGSLMAQITVKMLRLSPNILYSLKYSKQNGILYYAGMHIEKGHLRLVCRCAFVWRWFRSN